MLTSLHGQTDGQTDSRGETYIPPNLSFNDIKFGIPIFFKTFQFLFYVSPLCSATAL